MNSAAIEKYNGNLLRFKIGQTKHRKYKVAKSLKVITEKIEDTTYIVSLHNVQGEKYRIQPTQCPFIFKQFGASFTHFLIFCLKKKRKLLISAMSAKCTKKYTFNLHINCQYFYSEYIRPYSYYIDCMRYNRIS